MSHRNRTDGTPVNFALIDTPRGVGQFWSGRLWPARPVALTEDEGWAAKLLDAIKAQWPEPLRMIAEPLTPATVAEYLHRVGGAFAPLKDSRAEKREHDLTDPGYAWGLYRAASTVDVNDPDAVTRLESQWGRLGVGVAPSSEPADPHGIWILLHAVDSFAAARDELAAFQKSLHQLEGLRRGRAAEGAWREFGRSLDAHLSALSPTVRWHPQDGLLPALTVKKPREVLWATLWDVATRGGRLRRCRHCQILFPADDPRKVFCSKTCTNRASAARWYQRKGRQLRQTLRSRHARANRPT
jgi:hypothetical protein